MSVRVKICGVTTVEDVLVCAGAGADAIGLNFWSGSKRHVDLRRAAEIARALPSNVVKVGVFVNAERAAIEQAITAAGLDAIQLHGDETAEQCAGFAVKVIKAIRLRAPAGGGAFWDAPASQEPRPSAAPPPSLPQNANASLASVAERFTVDYILLDADCGADYGGGGRAFDWRLAEGVAPGRLFVAGGLRPDNVAQAVRVVRPYAVDTASGVESAPGRKDARLVKEFIANARHA